MVGNVPNFLVWCRGGRGGGPAGAGACILAGARGPAGANPGPRQTLHLSKNWWLGILEIIAI